MKISNDVANVLGKSKVEIMKNNKLIQAMKERNLSQSGLSRITGIERVAINFACNGRARLNADDEQAVNTALNAEVFEKTEAINLVGRECLICVDVHALQGKYLPTKITEMTIGPSSTKVRIKHPGTGKRIRVSLDTVTIV